MRRRPRWLTALFALWIVVPLVVPAPIHSCPMHEMLAPSSADEPLAHGEESHGAHHATHHAAPTHARSTHSHRHHCCTCVGVGCEAAVATIPPLAFVPFSPTVVGAVVPPTVEPSVGIDRRARHERPPAIGPPTSLI